MENIFKPIPPGRGFDPHHSLKFLKMNCKNCEKPLTRNNNYCSNNCQAELSWKKRKIIIESGIEGNKTNPDPKKFKQYLKEVRGHKCEICETKEWMNQLIPLILDHISGNSDDWSLKNLRLICPNCDHQTPTFSGRNKGNGRINRTKKRHEEGFCCKGLRS